MFRYCIVESNKVTQQMATISHCTSPEYMRHNETNTIVMWVGDKPDCLRNYPEIYDIKLELSKPEWTTNEELI